MSCHSFWESVGDAAADFDLLALIHQPNIR